MPWPAQVLLEDGSQSTASQNAFHAFSMAAAFTADTCPIDPTVTGTEIDDPSCSPFSAWSPNHTVRDDQHIYKPELGYYQHLHDGTVITNISAFQAPFTHSARATCNL